MIEHRVTVASYVVNLLGCVDLNCLIKFLIFRLHRCIGHRSSCSHALLHVSSIWQRGTMHPRTLVCSADRHVFIGFDTDQLVYGQGTACVGCT